MTVLVAAASRHGSTEEIALEIGSVLRERGVAADVASLGDVTSLEEYDAIVLGSGVYVGRWLEQARDFVDVHAQELRERRTWLFSSGPIGEPPVPAGDEAVKLDEVVAKTRPVEHRVFAGRVDRSSLGLGERAIMRVVRAEEGDYRDWDEIRRYAEGIADALSA
jgi:menaquinone-dependent protoporphyrinogen oxidase